MDRLWTALVFVAVLGLRGAAARDKTNLPQAKQEEGQTNNATAMRTVVPEPSAGGRVDPEILAGMYNRSLDVPIGREPTIAIDGAMLLRLSKKAALASNASMEAVANGTIAKGENATGSAGNATISPNGSTIPQMGAMPKTTTVSGSESSSSIGLSDEYWAKTGPVHDASGAPVIHLVNGTQTWIGPLPNTTAGANGTLALAGNSTAHLTNATRAQMGPLPNTSAGSPVVHITEATQRQMGPLFNSSASTLTVANDVPANGATHDGGLAADASGEEPPFKGGSQPGNDYNGESLGTKYTGAFNRSLENETNNSPLHTMGSLEELTVNIRETAAQRYRLAPDAEPQASSNRSNDPDVVAMREIASVVLDGPKENAAIMTDVVIRSVLPDGKNGTVTRDTELHEAIRGKFDDEDLMRRILESDANQAPARLEQGTCEGCPQPVSVVCSLCWPMDFCRPFASKVDIPCPMEPF